jgi:hypothetical protein
MFYLVAGRTILIETFDDWSQRAVSEIFSGWFFTLAPPHVTSDADVTVRIQCCVDLPAIPSDLASFAITSGGVCFTDEAVYYLRFDDAVIVFKTDSVVQVDLWVRQPHGSSSSTFVQLLSHALSPALRRCGLFEIHSAGVIPPESNTAIMIAGASGSGKSTLTARLANSGWGYLSDDILLLTEERKELELRAFRRFFALTGDTLAAVNLPGVKSDSLSPKQRLMPQDHFSREPVQQAKPAAIVFPTITGQRQSQMKSITVRETMSKLLRLCPWASYDKPTSVQHLRVLGLLANTSNGFELLAGTDILNDSNLTTQMFFHIVDKAALVH